MNFREICLKCRLSKKTCYCGKIVSFDPKIKFVVLTHYRESQNKIATGRMAHLFLENSKLIEGYNYTNSEEVNRLLQDNSNKCFVLYPGENSKSLKDPSILNTEIAGQVKKNIVIFVIDGTWITARKTMQRSKNLAELPRLKIDTNKTSNFRIRKQPQLHCLSTIEAIHEVIELTACITGFDLKSREHDRMIKAFNDFVDYQLSFLPN